MKVYDFDETIYKKDSTFEFYKFCLKKRPAILKYLPKQGIYFVLWKLKFTEKEKFKEIFYEFLKGIDDVDQMVRLFWNENIEYIEPWYLSQQEATDVVISASPEFLLSEICLRLKIHNLIASKVNKQTGELESPNCYGEEKVARFRAEFPNQKVTEFYSDSLSDKPMGSIANEFILVKNGRREKCDI